MKTKFLLLFTIALFIFTASAFSLMILNNRPILLPFAVLGLVLMLVFKVKLNKVK